MAHELPVGMADEIVLRDQDSTKVEASRSILQSALAALGERRIAEVVALFDEHFKFNDHALALEFTERACPTKVFEKSRELFPDTTLEVVSLLENGDHAVAEWKLAATQTMAYGSISYRLPISLYGSTIVRVKDGGIVQWPDYYDQVSSRRTGLASLFTEWIEY
jgi:ketosteroid isomerase-like protein